MTRTLFNILLSRYARRVEDIPWIFWHRYRSQTTGELIIALYRDRKKFMKTLCRKADVPYFRFHPIRHTGASFMDSINIPISSIQQLLGHEIRKTTEIYIHTSNENQRSVIDIYEKARNLLSKELDSTIL